MHLRPDALEQGQESKGRSIALLPHGSIQGSHSKERPGVVRVQERNGGDLNALKDQNDKGACLVSHAVANPTICKGLQTSLPNARQGLRRDDDAEMPRVTFIQRFKPRGRVRAKQPDIAAFRNTPAAETKCAHAPESDTLNLLYTTTYT